MDVENRGHCRPFVVRCAGRCVLRSCPACIPSGQVPPRVGSGGGVRGTGEVVSRTFHAGGGLTRRRWSENSRDHLLADRGERILLAGQVLLPRVGIPDFARRAIADDDDVTIGDTQRRTPDDPPNKERRRPWASTDEQTPLPTRTKAAPPISTPLIVQQDDAATLSRVERQTGVVDAPSEPTDPETAALAAEAFGPSRDSYQHYYDSGGAAKHYSSTKPPPTIGFGSPLQYPSSVRGVWAPWCLWGGPDQATCTCYGPFSHTRPWGYYCVLMVDPWTPSPPPPGATPGDAPPSPPPPGTPGTPGTPGDAPSPPPPVPPSPPSPPVTACGDLFPGASCGPDPAGPACGFCVFEVPQDVFLCCCDNLCESVGDCCSDYATCCAAGLSSASNVTNGTNGTNDTNATKGISWYAAARERDDDEVMKRKTTNTDECGALKPGSAKIRSEDGGLLLTRRVAADAIETLKRRTRAALDRKAASAEGVEYTRRTTMFRDTCVEAFKDGDVREALRRFGSGRTR